MTSHSSIQLTQEEGNSIPDSAWKLVSETEDYWRWEARVTLESGQTGSVFKTTYKGAEELLALNAEMRKDNAERRYTAGMGSDKGGNMPMVHTAQIPLNVYFNPIHGIAKRQAAGDKDHLRWWLRREENAPFLVRDQKGLRK